MHVHHPGFDGTGPDLGASVTMAVRTYLSLWA
jgi:hypothetical protein